MLKDTNSELRNVVGINNDLIPKYIRDMNNYQPPLSEKVKNRLYLNENLFGPSPECIRILSDLSTEDLFQYSYQGDLCICKKIAETFRISENNICLNHGSSEVIRQVISVLVEANQNIMIPMPGWGYYKDASDLVGANTYYYSLLQTEREFKYNVHTIFQEIDETSPKLVIITSPNMPTGNKMLQIDLEAILSNFSNIIFVVDEAYWGFDFSNQLDINYLINRYKNLIIIRTFSKFFGLAGVRIGYLITNQLLCIQLRKAAPLFGISYIAQLMVNAAIDSKQYYNNMRLEIQKEIRIFKNEINKLPEFYCYETSANFLLIKVPEGRSQEIVNYLSNKGYLVRECSKYGLESFVRISIGTPDVNNAVIGVLNNYVSDEL